MAVLHPVGTSPVEWGTRPRYPWEQENTQSPNLPDFVKGGRPLKTQPSPAKRARMDRKNKKLRERTAKIKELREQFRLQQIARMKAGFAVPLSEEKDFEAKLKDLVKRKLI